MPGEVATVNGQGISFMELEARRTEIFTGRTAGSEKLDDAALQEQFRYALNELIEELLVCQYMRGQKLDLPEGAVQTEEERIRADYPEGAFEEMLIERGLSLDLWRQGLYRRLVNEQFLLRVLRPEISITAEEVQQYYRAHSDEFLIPEQWHFLYIVGAERKDVELARKRILEGEDPAAVQKVLLVTIHDVRMGIDLLPSDLRQALAPLTPGGASAVSESDGEFRAQVLLDTIPASSLDAAEISKRVESSLSEEKMRSIHTDWIQRRLESADIRIAPALLGTMPVNGTGSSAGEPMRQDADTQEGGTEAEPGSEQQRPSGEAGAMSPEAKGK